MEKATESRVGRPIRANFDGLWWNYDPDTKLWTVDANDGYNDPAIHVAAVPALLFMWEHHLFNRTYNRVDDRFYVRDGDTSDQIIYAASPHNWPYYITRTHLNTLKKYTRLLLAPED